ncbi:MAG: addiction module HigA family antidote [Halioglobus sp.]|jgi:addiction module HigA family antidote
MLTLLTITKGMHMFEYKRKPTSPGEILKEEFLKPLGLTQKQLATHIDCDLKVINRIINEKSSITPSIAVRLAMALETTPFFWLNAQIALDLWNLKSKKGEPSIASLV